MSVQTACALNDWNNFLNHLNKYKLKNANNLTTDVLNVTNNLLSYELQAMYTFCLASKASSAAFILATESSSSFLKTKTITNSSSWIG